MTIGYIGDGSTIAPECMPGDQLTQDATGNYICATTVTAPAPSAGLTIAGDTVSLSLPMIMIPIGLLVAFAIMGAKR